MIYLKKYVKFRQEGEYLLICDCSIIQNFELPIDTLPLFEKLKKGYDPSNPLGVPREGDIIEDLKNLDFVDNVPNSNKGFSAKRWINLGYQESEFFQP